MYTFSFLLINLNIKYFLRSHYGKKSKIYGISFKGAYLYPCVCTPWYCTDNIFDIYVL